MYRIIIVDDEKIERNGIKMLLGQIGVEVQLREAVNGVKALELLKEEPADLLLTDIKMPFMDGIELIGEAVKLDSNMKIIIFSGYGEFEYARLAMKYGVSNYILKPVDPKEFKNTIQAVLKELDDAKMDVQKKEKSISFIREHVLYSLVNGMDLDAIVQAMDEIIDINEIEKYHRMILIEFNRDFFGRKSNDFAERIQQVLQLPYQYLNLNPQQSILFVEQTPEMNWREVGEELCSCIERYYDERCYVAISEHFATSAQIAKTYEVLEEIMENKFYQLENRVFLQNDQNEATMLVHIEDDTLMKQLRQDIKMKDIFGLRQHFERLCAKYHTNKDFSQVYIKFVFSNLLKDFYENLPDMKEKELNEEIDKLYKAADFATVMKIVNYNIDRLEATFDQNPQMVHREIESVKQYIYENYYKELSVEMLADQVYMAPSYLSHVFKKETGQNLSKFIKTLRMEKAKEMLEGTHDKIVNISYAVGYPNVSYFCQSFREYFGISPQRFRNQGEINEDDSTI